MEKKLIKAHKNNLTDLTPILEDLTLDLIGYGIFSDVYKIKGHPWVIKVSKWEISKALVPYEVKDEEFYIKFDKFFDRYLSEILPKPEFIQKQYDEYLKLSKYLGYFTEDHHLNHLYEEQNQIRMDFVEDFDEVLKWVNLKFDSTRKDRIIEQYLHYNFLPKEYTFYGKGVPNKETAHIFQEYISGNTLGNTKNFNQKQKDLLSLFLLLVLYFDLKEGNMVDLRPKDIVINPASWVRQTGNIVLNESEVKFVDTRWLWDRRAKNLYRNNMLIFSTLLLSIRQMLVKLGN